MLYVVKWPRGDKLRADSKLATWDGRVTDATLALSWLINKSIEHAIETLSTRYMAKVLLVPNSHHIDRVPYDYH